MNALVGYLDHDLIADLEYFHVTAAEDWDMNNVQYCILFSKAFPHCITDLKLVTINQYFPQNSDSEWESEFY